MLLNNFEHFIDYTTTWVVGRQTLKLQNKHLNNMVVRVIAHIYATICILYLHVKGRHKPLFSKYGPEN